LKLSYVAFVEQAGPRPTDHERDKDSPQYDFLGRMWDNALANFQAGWDGGFAAAGKIAVDTIERHPLPQNEERCADPRCQHPKWEHDRGAYACRGDRNDKPEFPCSCNRFQAKLGYDNAQQAPPEMPTREQIAEALAPHFLGPDSYNLNHRLRIADAVLALFRAEAKPDRDEVRPSAMARQPDTR